MRKQLIELTDELCEAIDEARGTAPRNPWLEQALWRLKAVRDAADRVGVVKPIRPIDGRGKWGRK